MNMRHEMEEVAVGHHQGQHEHHQHEAAGDGGGGAMEEHMKMGMKMYFHGGLGDPFLFYNFTIDTHLKLWLASVLLFGLALLAEWLHYLQSFRCDCEWALAGRRAGAEALCCERLEGRATGRGRNGSSGRALEGKRPVGRCNPSGFWHRHKSQRSLKALLQLLRTSLSLVLMLAAMTYNVCLISAILSGAALGFYIFSRPIFYTESEQLCH